MKVKTLERANDIRFQIENLVEVMDVTKKTIMTKQQSLKITLCIEKIIEELEIEFSKL